MGINTLISSVFWINLPNHAVDMRILGSLNIASFSCSFKLTEVNLSAGFLSWQALDFVMLCFTILLL